MAARAIWKGSIAFGLVQIPVSLKAAEEPDELSFDLLDSRDLSPVGYQRVNKRTGRKVDWKNVVKGYEYKKGRYVVVTDRDFERANVEATHTIDIELFVDPSSIDPRYFERPYYLFPDKAGAKAYVLLRDALTRGEKAAVARVVIRTRQHLALIVPQDERLLLLLLRFEHELRRPEKLELPRGGARNVTAKERQMAETLVESMAGEWHPEKFKDTYRDDLLKLIRDKVKHGEPEEPEPEEEPQRGAKVIDLAELLKQSLSKKRKPARATKKQRTRKATAQRKLKKSA
ncbi:MAG TPA: Ku protein [Polyangiaceae bacterium]|nr:Ku protein [Polyangiaceae bacterium]